MLLIMNFSPEIRVWMRIVAMRRTTESPSIRRVGMTMIVVIFASDGSLKSMEGSMKISTMVAEKFTRVIRETV